MRIPAAYEKVARIGPRPGLIVRDLTYRTFLKANRPLLRRDYERRVLERPEDVGFVPLDVVPPALEELPAALLDGAERIRAEAELTRAHEFDLLGSGPVRLGAEIEWHRDFKSGAEWPRVFYMDLPVDLTPDSDPKVPWELSRAHQLLALGRAAAIYGDERYAAELEFQLASWIEQNPPGIGINWTNPMEVALRAVNWAWAVSAMTGLRPLSQALERDFVRSLQAHGRHIATNLEGTPYLRSNHFLADILGLLAIATVLPGDPLAPKWSRRARRWFEREVRAQVLPDGVGFEASLAYHGLALEMFLVAWWLGESGGRPFSAEYGRRVAAMLDVSQSVRHPDGRIPAFGDADDGRVLPERHRRSFNQDHLLWAGAGLLGVPCTADPGPASEVAWNYGRAVWERATSNAEKPPSPVWGTPRQFSNGGLYVLGGGGAHAVVRCGDVGQNGNGGHAHNDLLSYELSYGAPVVVDPGTYVYTADPAARDAFRATASHNTIVIAGEEINPLPAGEPFRLRQEADPSVQLWQVTEEQVRLIATHDGYERLAQRVTHRRSFELDRRSGELLILDELLGVGRVEATLHIHLAANLDVVPIRADAVELRWDSGSAELELTARDAPLDVCDGWVSPSYGVRLRAPVVRATAAGRLPISFRHRFVPGATPGASESRGRPDRSQ